MQQRNRSWVWAFPLLLIPGAVALAVGIRLAVIDRPEHSLIAAGGLGIVLVLLAWVVTATLRASRAANLARIEEILAPLNERVQQISVLLNQVSEQQLISERAKGIAFRNSEREALRRAIHEETNAKNWDAALLLAREIETVFGYKQEADTFRAEIESLRKGEMRRAIEEGMAAIDRFCRGEQWTEAMRDAERLAGAFPDDAQAAHLPADVEARRQAHKKQLLDKWNEAVSRHDVDGSIDILRQLDLYLTPQEGAAMQETARQVFKDKLQMLGQQFTLAVKEHRWTEAIKLGESIAAEFPNSRMAQEVREKMDLLKQRAAELAPA